MIVIMQICKFVGIRYVNMLSLTQKPLDLVVTFRRGTTDQLPVRPGFACKLHVFLSSYTYMYNICTKTECSLLTKRSIVSTVMISGKRICTHNILSVNMALYSPSNIVHTA